VSGDGPMDAEVAREVVARLAAGRSLDELGLGVVDGRVDVRGLHVDDQVVMLQDVRVADLDLRDARIPSWRFDGCVVLDCLFDRASCRDWRLWRTQARRCSFVEADLSDAAVGTWEGGEGNLWSHVDFTGADLRALVNQGATYEECELADADLTGVAFEQCTLRRCHFAGDLREVVFDGRPTADRPAPSPWEDVDFSEARFHQVDFLGIDLGSVSLPADRG
jgi:uncharacterized protein YjbI with pentapeptide repeats